MEEFIDNVKILVNTLGHRVFDDKPEINSIEKEEILYLETGNGDRACKAVGMQTIDGFLVSKGSKIAEETTFSLQKSIQKKNRESYFYWNNQRFCLYRKLYFF